MLCNLTTKSCVHRGQWKKLPTPQLIVDIMNKLAGITGVTLADLPPSKVPQEDAPMLVIHDPVASGGMMVQDLPEAMVLGEEENLTGVPDLVNIDNDDSDSESGDSVDDQDDQELGDDPELEELERLLNKETDIEEKAEEMMHPLLRRSAKSTAGTSKYDNQYEWNLYVSVGEV